jgi:hypothetical protein
MFVVSSFGRLYFEEKKIVLPPSKVHMIFVLWVEWWWYRELGVQTLFGMFGRTA